MKKFLCVLFTVVLLFPCYMHSQSNNYCEGEWIEEITTYNCSTFNNQVSCENIQGCSWQYSWGGWVSGGSNDCVGGQVTIDNSYCDGEMVTIFLGCTDESAINYNPNANQDDGSCYFENNSDLCVANPIDQCMSIAVWDPVCGCDGVTYSNSGDAACNSIYDFTSGECNNISDNPCTSISILLSQGWNMIGFYCSENTNALNAFDAIQDKIIIAKDAVGNAYLPDWDFNGIGDLERGYGYLIKVSEEISNYSICE